MQVFAIPPNNMYRRAAVAANRPLTCACSAYKWLHRRGLGKCQLLPHSLLARTH